MEIRVIQTLPSPSAAQALPPPAAFSNASQVDLSKDFYPLGEQPRFNDTFYVACPEALARPGATVTLSVTLTNPPKVTEGLVLPVRTADSPALAWEVSDGRQWIATAADYSLTTSGAASITLPSPIAATSVNGDERYWLRARLVRGSYGAAASYAESGGSYSFVPGNVAPPVIKRCRSRPPMRRRPRPPPRPA